MLREVDGSQVSMLSFFPFTLSSPHCDGIDSTFLLSDVHVSYTLFSGIDIPRKIHLATKDHNGCLVKRDILVNTN